MRNMMLKLVKTADDDCNDEINVALLSSYNIIIAYCFPFLESKKEEALCRGWGRGVSESSDWLVIYKWFTVTFT